MNFRSDQTRERSMLVDLTPMIDVVFLLIIFFMTTAQFVRMTRAEVDLPKQPGEGAEAQEETGVVINILEDGSINVDNERISLEQLRSIIEDEVAQHEGEGGAENVKLLIRADRKLPTSRLNEVVRMLQDLGVGLGRFGTEIPTS